MSWNRSVPSEPAGAAPRRVLRALSLTLGGLALGLGLSTDASAQLASHGTTERSSEAALLANLDLTGGEVQTFDLPVGLDAPFELPLRVDGSAQLLRLRPHSVRSPDYRLLVAGADGVPREVPAPLPSTVRGEVAGWPGSVVSGSLREGKLTALVTFQGTGEAWGIEPLDANGLHVVHLTDDIGQSGGEGCGVDTSGEHGPDDGAPPPGGPLGQTFGVSKIPMMLVDIGLDADVETFNVLGSVTAVQDHMETIMVGTSAVLEEYMGMQIEIQTVVVRTAEPDPYMGVQGESLLDQVETEWRFGIDGGPVPDLVQLFTGRNMPQIVGIGNIGGMCNGLRNASIVETFGYSGMVKRVRLSLHEFGHVLGAPHCSTGDCGVMCPALCGSWVSYGWDSIASMMFRKFPGPCLEFAEPPRPTVINALENTEVSAYNTGWVSVYGEGFTKTQAVEVDGEPMDPFFFRVVADEKLELRPPVGDRLGDREVRILGAAGPATPFRVTITGTDPPMHQVNALILTGQSLSWNWGGPDGDSAVLLLSLSPTTSPAWGWDVLNKTMRYYQAPLDALGMGGTTLEEVPAALDGLELHSQVLTYDDTGLTGATTVRKTKVITFP